MFSPAGRTPTYGQHIVMVISNGYWCVDVHSLILVNQPSHDVWNLKTWHDLNRAKSIIFFLSMMMLRVDNTPSRIVYALSPSSIITHPAHGFHFYNSPSISLYLPLPFPNSPLFHSCFPADSLFIIPHSLHLFQTSHSQVCLSSSELLYYLKFSSVTNALWVEKPGIRGCPLRSSAGPRTVSRHLLTNE